MHAFRLPLSLLLAGAAAALHAADTWPPTTPEDLIAVKATSTSLTLAWSPSRDDVGVTTYRVFKNGVIAATVSAPGATLAGLTAGTSYQFSVQAGDAAGNWSEVCDARSYYPGAPWTETITGAIYSYEEYDENGNYLNTYSTTDDHDQIRFSQAGTLTVTFSTGGSLHSAITCCDWLGGAQSNAGGYGGSATYSVAVTEVPGRAWVSVWGNNAWSAGDYTLTLQFQPAASSPVAYFDGTALSATAPLTAAFDATGSLAPPGGSIASYAWDLDGNGTYEATGATVTANYPAPPSSADGYFLARLRVTGGNGVVAATTRKVLDLSPPAVPGNVRVTGYGTQSGSSTFTLAWDASADNVGTAAYEVFANGSLLAYWCGTNALTVYSWAAPTPCTITVRAKDWRGNLSALSPPLYVEAPSVPTIALQPRRSAIVVAGQSATLVAGATGVPAPALQWKKDGVAIAGATLATYTLANFQSANEGTYTLTATNANGSATSDPAIVRLLPAGTSATHAAPATGYVAGSTLTIANTINYNASAGAIASLGWRVTLPAGWSYASGTNEGATKPAAGDTGTLDWSWTSIPASPVTFTYTVNVPAGTTGSKALNTVAITRQNGFNEAFQLSAKPGPLVVSPNSSSVPSADIGLLASDAPTLPDPLSHSADTNRNYNLSLLELTRVIELFNTRNGTTRTGCYKVDATGEDGFNPEPTRASSESVTLTSYHSADSNRDGKLSLLELTRVIELYNTRYGTFRTGEYHAQAGTEDGFNPGPDAFSPPFILMAPSPVSATQSESITLNVSAICLTAMTYQWRKDGQNIPGATAATLTLTNAQPADSGTYTMVVTNTPPGQTVAAQSATSPGVPVTIVAAVPPVITNTTLVSSGTFGAAFAGFTVTATGLPAPTFAATGLPSGLVINPDTGAITGTPTEANWGNPFTVALTASNAAGTDTQALLLTVNRIAPVFVGQIVYNQPQFVVTDAMVRASVTGGAGLAPPTGTITYSTAYLRLDNGLPVATTLPSTIFNTYPADVQATITYPGDANYSPTTGPVLFGNRDTVSPTQPTPFAIQIGVLSSTGFSVFWPTFSDIGGVSYRVELDLGTSSSQIVTATLNTVRFDGLLPNSAHTVRVRAVDYSGNASGWSASSGTIALPADNGTDSALSRWVDVDGDGLLDELIATGTNRLFTYASEWDTLFIDHQEWVDHYQWLPGVSYGETYYQEGRWIVTSVPVGAPPLEIPLIRPVFEYVTEGGYDYSIVRETVTPDSVSHYPLLFPPTHIPHPDGSGVDQGGIEFFDLGRLVGLDGFNAFPSTLVRLGKPAGGIQLNLPVLGTVQLGTRGGLSGRITLPGSIVINATTSGATMTIPGTGTTISTSGGNVTIGQNIGGYVVTANSNGQIALSNGAGVSLALGADGATVTLPGGLGVSVDGTGKVKFDVVAGASGNIVNNALDVLGKILGVGPLGPSVKMGTRPVGSTSPIIWEDPSAVDLGALSPGDYDVAVKADDQTNAHPNLIMWMSAKVKPSLKVEWIAVDSPLGANPNSGKGLSIFAGKTSPSDTVNRQKVKIRATLPEPNADVPVYFKVFDVDDPSSNSNPLDDETSVTDNRGTWSQPASSANTNSQGVAEVEFEVSMQPGDNFRALASTTSADAFIGLTAKQDDGTKARIKNASGQALVGSSSLAISNMLTVWRHIHIEVDSMGPVTGNEITGNITDIDGQVLTTDQTLNDSVDRFENGKLLKDGDSWTFTANTTGANFTFTASWIFTAPTIGPFTLKDDDATVLPRTADTSLVTGVFAPAYVVPLFDGAGGTNQNNAPFRANIELADVEPQLAAGRQSPNISNDYWSIYLLSAFQGEYAHDRDPDSESGVQAGVNPRSLTSYKGAFIYHEARRDVGGFQPESWSVAHEIGHYFNGIANGGHETDNSLMANGPDVTDPTFNATTLARIRNFTGGL